MIFAFIVHKAMINFFCTPYSIVVETDNMLGSTQFMNAAQTFHPVDLQGGRFFYLNNDPFL